MCSEKNDRHFLRVSICSWHTCKLNVSSIQRFQGTSNSIGEVLYSQARLIRPTVGRSQAPDEGLTARPIVNMGHQVLKSTSDKIRYGKMSSRCCYSSVPYKITFVLNLFAILHSTGVIKLGCRLDSKIIKTSRTSPSRASCGLSIVNIWRIMPVL